MVLPLPWVSLTAGNSDPRYGLEEILTTAEKDLSHRADVATRLLDSSDQLS